MKLLKRKNKATELTPAQGDGSLDAPAGVALTVEKDMGFLDHLEELRWHVIKGFAGIVIGIGVSGYFSDWFIQTLLLGPAHADFFVYRLIGYTTTDIALQNRTITGQFFAYWGTLISTGFILGLPLLIYQIWKFVEPGLYDNEKKGMRFIAVFISFFFFLGSAFGYLVLMPLSLQFFKNFIIDKSVLNQFDISAYFDMLTTSVFMTGVLFELPVVVYALAKLRIVTPETMRKSRRLALVIILIVSAIITPSTDMVSQTVVAVPLMLLYEASIWIAKYVTNKEEKAIKEALA
jgi:sec-independent protein translocase protein TatC